MTLRHLIIVGDGMRGVIVKLSKGDSTLPTRGTADVKPEIEVDEASIVDDFELMYLRFVQDATAAKVDAFPKVTHPHPWFGPLNARQWLVLAGAHERIHRNQIEAIIARL